MDNVIDNNLSCEQIIKSLRLFKTRRDEMLHEDTKAFEHYLERFVEFCRIDPLTQSVLRPLLAESTTPLDEWWSIATQRRSGRLTFPNDADEEFAFRYRILEYAIENPRRIWEFGFGQGSSKRDEAYEEFRNLLARAFAQELSHRLGEASNMATPEERELQAVPLHRIPSPNERKIFLSHKTADKPLVRRYFNALRQAGFEPWMDEADMPSGTNLERGLLDGFKLSCAAVFFITENFKDENFLATEVDYARMQLRKKGNKFTIITLRYSDAAAVPELLEPYVYVDVSNDLDGFYQILRALPIELGPIRWKASAVD